MPDHGMHGRRKDRCQLRVRALRDAREWIGQTPGAERVAMQVTGCRTRSVLDRYRIVGPADPRDVVRRITDTIPGPTG